MTSLRQHSVTMTTRYRYDNTNDVMTPPCQHDKIKSVSDLVSPFPLIKTVLFQSYPKFTGKFNRNDKSSLYAQVPEEYNEIDVYLYDGDKTLIEQRIGIKRNKDHIFP